MKRVGIYVFSDKIKVRTAKKRDTYYDGQNYIGLRYIVSEIDKEKYKIGYASRSSLNNFDFVLVSIISYYDVVNLINELYGLDIKATIIAGGPGLSNISLISSIVDVAIIGRGEGSINDILAGYTPDGVWRKNANEKDIKIRQFQHKIEIEDPILGWYEEKTVGCPKKCYFCQYSWKHRYNNIGGYTSGVADRETLFVDVNWETYKNKDLVTAVDGINEETRKVINKPISNKQIMDKIAERFSTEKDYISLKLYCLLGYAFEKDFDPVELLNTLVYRSDVGRQRLNILMVSPHFMPMPFTPMESDPVNTVNFRHKIDKFDFSQWQTKNVKVFWPTSQSSSPISATEATIINRAESDSADMIKKVICSSKYRGLKADMKVKTLVKYFGNLLGEVKDVVPIVQRPYMVDRAKEVYNKRKQAIKQ